MCVINNNFLWCLVNTSLTFKILWYELCGNSTNSAMIESNSSNSYVVHKIGTEMLENVAYNECNVQSLVLSL